MKIINMRKGSWGKLTAFFDVVTDEGFIINGFKLVNGINGFFVGFPSRKGTDENDEEKYYDTVYLAEDIRETMREKLNKMAIEEYNKDNPAESVNNDIAQDNDSKSSPPETSSDDAAPEEPVAESDDAAPEEPVAEQPFSQDDLPF